MITLLLTIFVGLCDLRDKAAFNMMKSQNPDIRRERASLGGQIGGPLSQMQHRARSTGRFSSANQSASGKRGAAVNRERGTGAFNPEYLKRANQVLKQNAELYLPQKKANLSKGLETQKENGINIGNSVKQRAKSIEEHGIVLNGIRYWVDEESCGSSQKPCVSETTFYYYLYFYPLQHGKNKGKVPYDIYPKKFFDF